VDPHETLQRARVLASQKSYPEAISLLTDHLSTHPRDKEALDLFGYVLFLQGEFAQAEACCRQALVLVPDDPYATTGLGLCLARQGRLDEGLVLLERSASSNPKWFDGTWDWLVVLRDAGRIDEAHRVLDRATNSIPSRRAEFENFRRSLGARRAGE